MRRVSELAGEVFPKFEAGPQQADFYIGFRQIQRFGSLPHREALNIAEDKDHPVFLVEALKSILEQRGSFATAN